MKLEFGVSEFEKECEDCLIESEEIESRASCSEKVKAGLLVPVDSVVGERGEIAAAR
jgi:hypothetical protein